MEEIRICTSTKLIDNKRNFIATINQDELDIYVETDTTSSNRALIIGITKALEYVPNNSKVEVLSPSNFGFKYLSNKKKWDNRDVGSELVNVINIKNIKVKFVNYSKTGEYKDIKTSLKGKLKFKYGQSELQNKIDTILEEENGILNFNEDTRYDVELYVRGSACTNEETKPGQYISVMICKGNVSEIYGKGINTTEQRMVLTGIIESLKKLKAPCNIKLYTHLYIGLRSYNRTRKGVNEELKEELLQIIKQGGHIVQISKDNKGQHILNQKMIKN